VADTSLSGAPVARELDRLTIERGNVQAWNIEYRGIEYSVVQGIRRNLWIWSASVANVGITGQSHSKSEAVVEAKKAIVRCAATSESPSPLPRTGVRLSRSWRDFLLLSAAPKEIVEHRKDFAAVADLAHRQRRSIGAQTLIQRPKR
jgi:hypothetical protein